MRGSRLIPNNDSSIISSLTAFKVSNIADAGYLGIRGTLAALTPLLEPPERNPKATLITLFLNAVMEIAKAGDEKDSIKNMKLLMDYLPTPDWTSEPKAIMISL
jgi:hypothetical protein